MKKIVLEVDSALYKKIENGAQRKNLTDEEFIKQILSRFIVDPHTINSKEVQEGYEECGPLNISIAND